MDCSCYGSTLPSHVVEVISAAKAAKIAPCNRGSAQFFEFAKSLSITFADALMLQIDHQRTFMNIFLHTIDALPQNLNTGLNHICRFAYHFLKFADVQAFQKPTLFLYFIPITIASVRHAEHYHTWLFSI